LTFKSDHSRTVLVVDDDITNRLILQALIKEAGYKYIEAVNGEQAVEAVDKHHIDIILMDVMMPVMDGYQAAKIIKSRQQRFIPIIFLTAMTDDASLAKCIESGGDDFLTKPYNHIILNAKINSMLRISGLYQNIEENNRQIEATNQILRQEMTVTKKLFDKVLLNDLRSSKTGLRYSMSPMLMFNGDLILAEKNQTSGLDILMADFTGHGLSAAIGTIPVSDVFHTMTQKCFAFTDMLVEANKKLLDLLPTQMFMAAAVISVDRSNNVLSVMNAGLPDIYLYRDNQIVHTFKSRNIPLGITDLTAAQFEVDMETLRYGDRILAATDGIIEAKNSSGEMFGSQRLLDVFSKNTRAADLFDEISTACMNFSRGAEQTDDITLLELTHLEEVEYETATEYKNEKRTPAEWSMQFSLDIKSLRQFDVLPYIMQGINQLQPLESGRTHVHTVLTEMFANALDHGVLGLDSAMKKSPEGYMAYYKEKQKRLETMEDGNIQLTLRHELNPEGGGRLSLYIVDSGPGYDYKSADLTNKNHFSGRGLKLISTLCTEIKVMGKGNAVMAYYDWEQP